MGWHATSNGVVAYEDGGSDGNLVMLSMPFATFMAVLDWSSAILVNKRSYIFEARGLNNNPPAIRNLPVSFGIKNDRPLGNVFYVEASDNDKLDTTDLKFSLEDSSPYFSVKQGLVMLIRQPPVQLFPLKIRVTDHCGDYVTGSLNISVIEAGPTTQSPFSKLKCVFGFEYDWLVSILVVMAFILIVVSLLIIFNKRGWLLQTSKTHPHPPVQAASVKGSYYNSYRDTHDSKVYNGPSAQEGIKEV